MYLTYIIAILILGVLIIVHELGHMFAGRAAGVKVEEFSVNIGPKLLAWKPKETQYTLRLIPLGGFCRFLGEEPDEESLTGPVPGSFYSVGPWKRLLIFVAGPLANILLSVLLCAVFAGAIGMPKHTVMNILPLSQADAYGLQIVAGRSFSEEYGDDVDKLVINETAVRNLGFASNDEAIGELVTVECTDAPMQIIGVVKDYHQQALSKNYTPIMLIHKDKIDWLPQRYISVVMASGNPRELVSQVQEIWNQYFADSSFDYFFLDQFFDHQYRQDEVFGAMIGSFTGLAIFISCLGLWVLVMFSCSTRTKEMGIRKVLGASRWNLFYQLVKGFFQLILIAVVIALPVAWFSMNAWLSHYAFRTDLKAWFFIVPVLLMLFISFVTVAFQTMKIIMSKPARSLRYE